MNDEVVRALELMALGMLRTIERQPEMNNYIIYTSDHSLFTAYEILLNSYVQQMENIKKVIEHIENSKRISDNENATV